MQLYGSWRAAWVLPDGGSDALRPRGRYV